MAKKILITKNLSEHSTIKMWCEEHPEYDLEHASQLKIELKKNDIPLSDWVFFSSKNAVEGYFFNQGSQQPKFAVIGNATATELKKHQCNASFIGQKNDTEKIAHDFSKILGTESVCFPVGNLSKRNMAQFVDANQIQFKIVYESILNPTTYDLCFDVIIFTSPSNVDSFLLKNKFSDKQQIISIGNTTAKHLENIQQNLNIFIPTSFSEEAILDSLKALL